MDFINDITADGITWPEAFVLVGLLAFAGFALVLIVAFLAWVISE